jgi:hypothetical protein
MFASEILFSEVIQEKLFFGSASLKSHQQETLQEDLHEVSQQKQVSRSASRKNFD